MERSVGYPALGSPERSVESSIVRWEFNALKG